MEKFEKRCLKRKIRHQDPFTLLTLVKGRGKRRGLHQIVMGEIQLLVVIFFSFYSLLL